MKKLLYLIMICFLSWTSYSSELEILIGVSTTHNTRLKYYRLNNQNENIIFKYKNFMLGHMVNSFNCSSIMIGYDIKLNRKLSASLMLCSGYHDYIYVYDKNGYILGNYKNDMSINNNYMFIGMVNYRISNNWIISSNGQVNTVNYVYKTNFSL